MITTPYLSQNRLREIAEAFLARYHPSGTLPIPIEEIAEFSLGLEIVPIHSLQSSLKIDGFLSNDRQRITVDNDVMRKCVTRYRFTLAHEIGHRALHTLFIRAQRYTNAAQWRVAMTAIPGETQKRLEFQANWFANFVLVPANSLEEEIAHLKADGYSEGVVPTLASTFGVSAAVIDRRLMWLSTANS